MLFFDMISVALDTNTLARTRFAVSPAMEAMAWLRLTATGRRHAVFGDPGPAARGALRHPDVALIADLLPPGGGAYLPDFLTPQPRAGSTGRAGLHDQIAEIESTPVDEVQAQAVFITERHSGRPVPLRVRRLTESGRLRQRIAYGVARFWREALDDGWAPLQAVLDNEIARQARLIAMHGMGLALGHIHSALSWTGAALTIDSRFAGRVDMAGHDLVFAPTALNWPVLMFQVGEAAPGTVYYPAGRSGGAGRADPADLAEVVGAVRAALLTDLGVARSTTELAVRQSVAPSTVSYHLAALHRAGLVTKDRAGRHVLYRRTERAAPLVGAAENHSG